MKFDMIRFVGVTNVDLPIVGATPSGPFVFKGADGLGAPEIDVLYARSRASKGVRQKKVPALRSHVVRVGLQPEWDVGQTPEELRTEIYGLLTPKYDQQVEMHILLDGVVQAEAKGDISRCEPSIFVKDPEVLITMECDDAYLLAPDIVYQIPARTISGTNTLFTVQNDGTAPAGFWIGVTLQSAQSDNLKLSENSALGRTMEVGGTWEAGDTLIIDTRPGTKGVWQIKAGTTAKKNMLNDLTGTSPWLMLHSGDNLLKLNNTAFDWYEDGFGHTPAYWGV